ncbi:hypothetical protein VTO73DRAFT_11397 [Trametes versicolor]
MRKRTPNTSPSLLRLTGPDTITYSPSSITTRYPPAFATRYRTTDLLGVLYGPGDSDGRGRHYEAAEVAYLFQISQNFLACAFVFAFGQSHNV